MEFQRISSFFLGGRFPWEHTHTEIMVAIKKRDQGEMEWDLNVCRNMKKKIGKTAIVLAMIYAPKRHTVANLQQKEQEEEHNFSRLSTQ